MREQRDGAFGGWCVARGTALAAAVAVMLLAPAAQAAVLTETSSRTGSGLVSLAQFDPSLGTLTAMNVVLSTDYSFTAHFTLEGSYQPSSSSVYAETSVTSSAAFGVTSFGENLQCDLDGVDANVSCNVSFASSMPFSAHPSELKFFTGTGTVGFVFGTSLYWYVTGLGNPQSLSDVSGPIHSASLTYTYDPAAVIPLPAGLPLLLGGIGVLGLIARRRPTET
jgi:hypothetical protein